MIVSMARGGIVHATMRMTVDDVVVGMPPGLSQLMRVFGQPSVCLHADMEHRGEPGQDQNQSEKGLPVTHLLQPAQKE